MSTIRLWLDDVRDPPDASWTVARTAQEARHVMIGGNVAEASLDHDLGICPRCTPGTVNNGANIVIMASLDAVCAKGCRCACHETGYDFVLWMAETGNWPTSRPRVHSANPVGRQRMEGVIHRYYAAPGDR